MKTLKRVYIVDAKRTAIVTANSKFKYIRPEVLGAKVLNNLPSEVDEIIAGNAVGMGGNIARLMALTAGFSENLPAITVDMQCASAAAAINMAYTKIACGQIESCIAGGMESASLQPLRVYHKNDERHFKISYSNDGNDIQGAYYTAQFSPNELSETAMLEGAERVAIAEGITKAELDAWAIKSHRRAAKAVELLKDCIVEVNGTVKDNGIKANINQKLLDRAPLPLGAGTLTSAGNACRINDGAAFVMLASEEYIKQNLLKPLAEIIAAVEYAGNPQESPRAAMLTADYLLNKVGLHYENLAAIEFNEAFAVIDVLFERKHNKLIDRYNRLGGALAYGHPYGASGAVLMIHLIMSLKCAEGGLGLMSIAGAGGTGAAILINGGD